MLEVDRRFISAEGPGLARAGAGGRACQGLYYAPQGRRPVTAVIASHYEVDFSEHYLADFLARRGYGFLGWNHRYRGNGAYFRLDPALADIAVGVRWLREQADVEQVVLLGNSGGASLMAAYQARAVRGEPAGGAELPAGDLFISLCAHPGRPDVLTAWLDPSVLDESDPLSVDPALDMYDRAHGPPYSSEFAERYRAAQRARNHNITAAVHRELERLGAAGVTDRLFCVPRTWADLRFTDLTLDPSDRAVGCYWGDPRQANYGAFGLAATCTLRNWLDMWSLAESRCRAAPHLNRVTQPALVIQSTGDQGCFPSDARDIFEQLASPDKVLEFVPGDHYLMTPVDGRDRVADLLADWLSGHGA